MIHYYPLHIRRQLHLSTYMFRIITASCPSNFINKFRYISGGSRDGDNCNLYTQNSRSHKVFFYLGAKCWNILPKSLRTLDNVKLFSAQYKQQLLKSILTDSDYKLENAYMTIFIKLKQLVELERITLR